MTWNRLSTAAAAVIVAGALAQGASGQNEPPEVVVIKGTVSNASGTGVANLQLRPRTHGDLNDDGRVDLLDVALLQQTYSPSPQGQLASWPKMVTQLRGPLFNINDPATW